MLFIQTTAAWEDEKEWGEGGGAKRDSATAQQNALFNSICPAD